MSNGFARVAAASVRVHLGDIDANEQEISAVMQRLSQRGVQLAVFPELCLTGYTLGDLLLQELVQRSAWDAVGRLAKQTEQMITIVGLPLRVCGRLYNCAAVLQDGQVRGIVPKTYLAEGGEFYEARWFSSGQGIRLHLSNSLEVLRDDKMDGIPFGDRLLFHATTFAFSVEICEDLWAPIPPSSYHAVHGADIVVNLSASNILVGKSQYRQQLISQQSARLYAGYVYAGAGYGESTSDVVFDGYTAVYENGKALAQGERFCTAGSEAVGDVDITRLRYQRQRNRSFFQGGREAQNGSTTVLLGSVCDAPSPLLRPIQPLPFVPTGQDAQLRLAEILNIQCTGLKTRLEAIRCKNLIIGVSGGLDSTLALLVGVLVMDALGYPRTGVHAITMPGMGTGHRTKTNADVLMKALGVGMLEISIEKAVLQHFQDIGQNPEHHDVTYENAQARERTQILMDYANRIGGIVLGTGDMSELALGFCTFNGDHMSMYNVNGSIPKTLVRVLVKHIACTHFDSQVQTVCEDIVATPVSPELLPAKNGEITQRTEDILGDYALHDFFLYHMLSAGAEPKKLRLMALQAFSDVYDEKTILRQLNTFLRKFFTQQFKRNCMPDGPKVGSVALSPRGDWRMPSDMGYALWLESLDLH